MRHTNLFKIDELRCKKLALHKKHDELKAINKNYMDRRISTQIGAYTQKINRLMKEIKQEEARNMSLVVSKLDTLRRTTFGTAFYADIVLIDTLLKPIIEQE